MLSDLERWVLFMSMTLEPSKPEAPNVWFDENQNSILYPIDANEAVHVIRNETAAVRARRYKFYDQGRILIVLLNYSDMNISDPVFENLETGHLRKESKLVGEGVAVSAHLAIDLKLSNPSHPMYNVVLEDVPGIGKTKIRPFLNKLFRDAPRLHFRDPEGVERRYHPKVDFAGKLSATLRDTLDGKDLLGLELVRYKCADDDWDGDGLFEADRSSVKLKPTKKLQGSDALSGINLIKRKAASRGFSNVRVVWSPVTGTQRSEEFGTAREDAGDVLTMRTEQIKVSDPLAQCEGEIRDDVATQLVDFLMGERP